MPVDPSVTRPQPGDLVSSPLFGEPVIDHISDYVDHVPRFDTGAARDTALPTPDKEQLCTVNQKLEMYDGTRWKVIAPTAASKFYGGATQPANPEPDAIWIEGDGSVWQFDDAAGQWNLVTVLPGSGAGTAQPSADDGQTIVAGSDNRLLFVHNPEELATPGLPLHGHVPTFADVAARDAAIPAPVAGQSVTIDSQLQVFDGTDWRDVAYQSGRNPSISISFNNLALAVHAGQTKTMSLDSSRPALPADFSYTDTPHSSIVPMASGRRPHGLIVKVAGHYIIEALVSTAGGGVLSQIMMLSNLVTAYTPVTTAQATMSLVRWIPAGTAIYIGVTCEVSGNMNSVTTGYIALERIL